MTNSDVTFDWNGETIRFNEWQKEDYGIYEYTTRDGQYYFVFDLKKVGSEVRIYIKEQPNYGSRDSDGHSTHRLSDDNGQYVCVRGDLEPNNVPDALSWLVYWSEETGKYLTSGSAFS